MLYEAKYQHFYQMFESIVLHLLQKQKKIREEVFKELTNLALVIKYLQLIVRLIVDIIDNPNF